MEARDVVWRVVAVDDPGLADRLDALLYAHRRLESSGQVAAPDGPSTSVHPPGRPLFARIIKTPETP